MKLSKKQEEVMEWINGGWTLYHTRGFVIEVNGKRICNLDTVNALEKKGLVERVGRWEWKKRRPE